MALPSPEVFAAGLYTDTGKELDPDDPILQALVQHYSATDERGVPQIQIPVLSNADPVDSAARIACGELANRFAIDNPELGAEIGAVGLYKIAFACTAEKKGEAPAGYTQDVVTAMQRQEEPRWWARPALWIGLAGGAVLSFFFLRRRRRPRLKGAYA